MATVPETVRSPADDDVPDGLERQHVSPSDLGEVTVEDPDDGGKPRITVPVSSTEAHRSDGKIMTEDALASMAEQLDAGEVGLWDDHGLSTQTGWREYRREDMYGHWVAGEVDDDGVLWATAELMPNREETRTLLEQLDADLPVGFSVGYKPTEEEMLATGEDGDEKVRHIMDLDLWETSPVGIPDNPAAIAMADALDRADVDVDHELASTIAASVQEGLETESMTDTPDNDSTDSGETPDEGADAGTETTDGEDAGATPPEARFSDTEVEEIMGIVGAGLESGLENALADIEQDLQEADGGDDGGDEESAGVSVEVRESDGDEDDDDDEDDEEESASATPDALAELQERLDALEQRNEDLEERLEEKEATIDRLESETRQSAGRKGVSPAAAGGTDADGEESADADGDAGAGDDESRSKRDALTEAHRLGGGI